MERAFIFDMDGVVVDSARAWKIHNDAFLHKTFGKEVFEKLGSVAGLGVIQIWEMAAVDKGDFIKKYNYDARNIYSRTPITPGVEYLAQWLTKEGFVLGLVTAANETFANHVLPRLAFRDQLRTIIFLGDRTDIKPKPAPDGYIEALRRLNAEPRQSIILEDSNFGIKAGKASGVYTIGYRGNLVLGYTQEGADAYADSMDDVINIVEKSTPR